MCVFVCVCLFVVCVCFLLTWLLACLFVCACLFDVFVCLLVYSRVCLCVWLLWLLVCVFVLLIACVSDCLFGCSVVVLVCLSV